MTKQITRQELSGFLDSVNNTIGALELCLIDDTLIHAFGNGLGIRKGDDGKPQVVGVELAHPADTFPAGARFTNGAGEQTHIVKRSEVAKPALERVTASRELLREASQQVVRSPFAWS